MSENPPMANPDAVPGIHGVDAYGYKGVSESEWEKLKPVGDAEPQTMVTVSINEDDFTVDVNISVPKGSWEVKHLVERASRAADEAMQPRVAQ